jgi:hypothetical protein
MPYDDPTEELNEIIYLANSGKLPSKAFEWASSALDTAEDILESIDTMQSKGIDAPTYSQEDALENIYKGACKWLHITPTT